MPTTKLSASDKKYDKSKIFELGCAENKTNRGRGKQVI